MHVVDAKKGIQSLKTCSKTLHDELRRLIGVEPFTTVIRNGRLRWYGHVMRKRDEDWVKKCMEFRV